MQILDGLVLQKDWQVRQSHVESDRLVRSAELKLHQDDQVSEDEASDGNKVGCKRWSNKILHRKRNFSVSAGNILAEGERLNAKTVLSG